jgi:hypothetical protein
VEPAPEEPDQREIGDPLKVSFLSQVNSTHQIRHHVKTLHDSSEFIQTLKFKEHLLTV